MAERKPTSLFLGRFQPFHQGHMLVVSGMVKLCDKVIIGVGSTDKKGKDNPYTFEERREMIQRALQGKDIIPKYDVSFIDLPDHQDDQAWVLQVLEKTGRIDQVWTGNDWTKDCFKNVDVEIKDIKEVPGISATEVRKRMREGDDWKSLVPAEVAAYIKAIDGEERVK